MREPNIVNRADWLLERRKLLDMEKAFTRDRDRIAQARRDLPMVRIERQYTFDTQDGPSDLAGLFDGKRQLVIYHFMFGSDWKEGCPSCSFWADGFDGIDIHLAARDTAFLCVSNAPLATLLAYRQRMGWNFRWVSAGGTGFSRDFGVTFEPGKAPSAEGYNYTGEQPSGEMPGISVFYRLKDGGIAHAYSTYARGLDIVNPAYNLLDMTPVGRDEDGLPWPMAWVRRHDSYDSARRPGA